MFLVLKQLWFKNKKIYRLFIETRKSNSVLTKRNHSMTYLKYYDTIVKVVMKSVFFGDAVDISTNNLVYSNYQLRTPGY